jgi:hypothetical protein
MSREPKRKALIIAISEYNDKLLDSLEFCKNDGEKMYELLKSLHYEISDNHKLIGYVEFDKIKDAIYDFFDNRKTNADDTLLFYYSGHGIPISGGNTCLASSEIDYYSPRKMGFSSHELTTLIQESNSIRIVEVLDCCYSGAARIGKGIGTEDAGCYQSGLGRLIPSPEGKDKLFCRNCGRTFDKEEINNKGKPAKSLTKPQHSPILISQKSKNKKKPKFDTPNSQLTEEDLDDIRKSTGTNAI